MYEKKVWRRKWGFEISFITWFNNTENTAGTVKAMEGSGKQC